MSQIKNKLDENIIKVYRKKDAPKGAVFVSKMIERDGMLDISITDIRILKTNERIVYLFKMPGIMLN